MLGAFILGDPDAFSDYELMTSEQKQVCVAEGTGLREWLIVEERLTEVRKIFYKE